MLSFVMPQRGEILFVYDFTSTLHYEVILLYLINSLRSHGNAMK